MRVLYTSIDFGIATVASIDQNTIQSTLIYLTATYLTRPAI